MRLHKQASVVFWGVHAPLACVTLVLGVMALKGRGSLLVNAWLVSPQMIITCFSFTLSTLALVFMFEWLKESSAPRSVVWDSIVCSALLLISLPASLFLLILWYAWIGIRRLLGVERRLSQRRPR